MKPFEKIIKRPALMNYYLNRKFHWPDTLPEIFDYLRQRDELPFLYLSLIHISEPTRP